VSDPKLDFRILGPLEVGQIDEQPGGEQLELGFGKLRAVLAIVVVHAGRPVTTEQMIERLWPDKPPGRPQTAIQGYISALRKLLGPEAIETTAAGYVLHAEPDQVDAHRFERFLREGRDTLAAGNNEQAAHRLSEALDLWRGPALADFTYEAWAQQEIARLEELRTVSREEQFEAQLALGHHRELVSDLDGFINEHPLRERPRGQLMLALYRSGRQAEALEVYQNTRKHFIDELGIDPGPELQALNKQILNQDATLTIEANRETPLTNLPAPPNALIGRTKEAQEVAELLQRDDVRLVTLTGPGGTGKTRLAQQVAIDALKNFRDGVIFTSLAPISDPNLVLPAIAQSLRVRDAVGEDVLEALIDQVGEKRILLLLDNFEHVVEAASGLAAMIAAAPNVNVLATSRSPLHLSGEHEYAVPPLALPNNATETVSDLLEYESIQLFIARARALQAGFELNRENAASVAEICARLDGLPLAIELAAARVRVLPPRALLERLDQRLSLLTGGARDLPERQQTLRGAIDWSYSLLTAQEQHLLNCLAVFRAGCTLEAAFDVCGPEGELATATLDSLESLVEKNLVRQREGRDGRPRFSMLETIRDFAGERLEQSGAAASVVQRHSEYFIALCKKIEPELLVRPEWFDRLQDEHANLIVALQSLRDTGGSTGGLELSSTLARYWQVRGRPSEGRNWIDVFLSKEPNPPLALHAKALRALAILAAEQGDMAAERLFGEALALAKEAGDWTSAADCLISIGMFGITSGSDRRTEASYLRAQNLFDEAARLARGDGAKYQLMRALDALCLIASLRGKQSQAESQLTTVLALQDELGAVRAKAISLNNMGYFLMRKDLNVSERRLRGSLALAREIDDRTLITVVGGNLGLNALYRGDLDAAVQHLLDALSNFDEVEDKEPFLEMLVAVAACQAAQGRPADAATLLGAAEATRATFKRGFQDEEIFMRENYFQTDEMVLGPFANAREEGLAMQLDQAVLLALRLAQRSRSPSGPPIAV
jgi:predicted ATPase/DNA-binding SARP family transcriptional activator